PAGAIGATGAQGGPGLVFIAGGGTGGATYNADDVVTHLGNTYVSLQGSNTGHDPSASPGFLELLAAKGDTGAPGGPGPAGPVGAQGPAGAQGIAGAQGPQGPIGPTGPQGDAGVAGPTGPQGAIGPQGPQGVTGPIGATGSQGGPGLVFVPGGWTGGATYNT